MKKIIFSLMLIVTATVYLFAQEEKEEKKGTPVTAFESSFMVDDQTTNVADKKTLEFAIQHKFATMSKGISDLWGIYGAGTNIRLAIDYVPVKNLQLGAGITKNKMYTDVNAKYLLLQQKTVGMPVSVALYGVAAVDGRNISAFETGKVKNTQAKTDSYSDVAFSDRLSYFSQILVSRKFTDWLSVQGGASFSHFNMAKITGNHDLIGLHALGRVKISPQSSITVNYNAPLKIQDISEQKVVPDYKPNLTLGWQISTFTHVFQLYVGNSPSMIPQESMMFNTNPIDKNSIAIGFTITRLWQF